MVQHLAANRGSAGISFENLRLFVAGSHVPTQAQLLALARYFQMKVEEIQ